MDQFTHFWNHFALVVEQFHGYDWRNKGAGLTKPDRLAYHIFKTTRRYVKDEGALSFGSGRSFDLEEAELRPSREEILSLVDYFRDLCCQWVEGMVLYEEGVPVPQAGAARFSEVLLLLRHSAFHLGEMEGILNEAQFGKTPDLWSVAREGEGKKSLPERESMA